MNRDDALRHRPQRHCARCGLPSEYPGVGFDTAGVCDLCHAYDAVAEHARRYFRTMDDLAELLAAESGRRRGDHDCMMLLSGGKDSTYALSRLVEMGLSVYAFSFDNGYISEEAKANVRRVAAELGVDHEIATTPAMGAIFRDSLERFSNVCNGCFKTIYTLGIRRARELGIPVVVTGLSRGQLFETRLSEGAFRDGRFGPDAIDAAVLAARKAYHRRDDAVSRHLDVKLFQGGAIFEEVRLVDFYRYCDVGLDELYAHLDERLPWVRPADTGRSTNCRINDAGIWVHRRERGFHNYALPYSWDVRLGHKSRDEAIAELEDEIDEAAVREMLAEVGYAVEPADGAAGGELRLAAFFTASRPLAVEELRGHLEGLLPRRMVPSTLRRVDDIPLTPHGKADVAALLARGAAAGGEPAEGARVPPEGPVEERIASLWERILGRTGVGAESSFFVLGGTSLGAMEVVLELGRELDVELPLESLFEHPTVRELAAVVEEAIVAEVAALDDVEAERLTGGGPGVA